MKDCILLTIEYPYGNSETFIENELLFLSQRFNRIYIFSLNGKRGHACRKVPDNVNVIALGFCDSKIRYLKYSIMGLTVKDACLYSYFPSLRKVLASLYYRGRGNAAYNRIARNLVKKHFSSKMVIIYSYWFTDLSYVAWKLSNFLKSRGIRNKSVSRAHGYDLFWERNKLGFIPFQDVSINMLSGIYTCSEEGKRYLEKRYGDVCWNKVHVSRLGTIDHGMARNINFEKVFVTCSALVPVKRMDSFALAFSEICKKHSSCKWIHFGDGPERKKVEKIISDYNMNDRVQLKGYVSNNVIIDFYKNNSVWFFCNVSSSEGVPVSIMEALSFGIPVIATDVGGNGELISHHNGFLLSGLNKNSLVETLEKALYLNDECYYAMRKCARDTWKQFADAKVNYSDWIDILYEEE